MKRVLTFILMPLSCFAYEDLLATLELNQSSRSLDDFEENAKLVHYKIENLTTALITRTARPNTFLWYLWNEYDNSTPIKKYYILNDINKLTQEKIK